jgi:hypothetical protein
VIDLVALARTLHGHLGLLAAVALLHPAVALRPQGPVRRGTRWSVILATTLLTATVVAGWVLYPGYRRVERPPLFQLAPQVAYLFESKEHLAFFALVLAWAGCALVFVPAEPAARRLARFSFGAAAAISLVVGVLGSIVASTPVPP